MSSQDIGSLRKEGNSTEIRGGTDAVDLRQQFPPPHFQIPPGRCVVGFVGRLYRQCLHAVEHVMNFRQSALTYISKTDSVVNVAHSLIQTVDAAAHGL